MLLGSDSCRQRNGVSAAPSHKGGCDQEPHDEAEVLLHLQNFQTSEGFTLLHLR